jgi:hypothetical protein
VLKQGQFLITNAFATHVIRLVTTFVVIMHMPTGVVNSRWSGLQMAVLELPTMVGAAVFACRDALRRACNRLHG